MRQVFQVILISILAGLILYSCNEDNPVNNENDTDDQGLSWLSGDWRGTLTITRIGDCTIAGEDSTISDITLGLSISKGGDVTISESAFSSEWTGYVLHNLEYMFYKTVTWERGVNMSAESCSDSIVITTATYQGVIEQGDNSIYTINMTGTENWCPVNNCSYRLHYQISKFCNP